MKSQNRWHQIPLMEAGLLCREAVPGGVKTHSKEVFRRTFGISPPVNGSALRGYSGTCPIGTVALGGRLKDLDEAHT